MSSWRAVREVARRELVERSRSRVLRVSLALAVVASVGGAVAAVSLGEGVPTDSVALVGARSAALAPTLRLAAASAGRHVRLRLLATAPSARRLVRDGTVEVAVLGGSRLLVRSDPSAPAVRVVRDALAAERVLDRLRASGLSRAEALAALQPARIATEVLAPQRPGYDRDRALIAVGLVALFSALVFFGQAVAQGVTEEKSSRVVELLLTAVPARALLAGKVLGIGALGLGLLLIPSAAALVGAQLAGGAGVPSAAPETVALILLWFILGYAFFSVAFAAIGALVSRQEDLNTAMLPINLLLIGAFYLALIAAEGDPNGTVARVAAFLPPLAPMVVPARVVLGDMGTLELLIAVALELAGTAAMVALAARAYEGAILRIGAPLKLHRLLRGGSRGGGRGGGPFAARLRGERERLALSPRADLALRGLAVALVIAAALLGFGEPPALGMLGGGLALLLLDRAARRGPRRPTR